MLRRMAIADELGLVGGTFPIADGSGPIRFDACVDGGGVGIVYRGWHLGLGTQVAIKCVVLSRVEERLRDESVRRFRSEAEFVERLSSGARHIVSLIAAGELVAPASGERVLVSVLEWLDGRTLRAHLEERRDRWRTLEEALGLLDGVAAALETAHRQGCVHRDLGPANLMVVPDGDGVYVKIADFGIAKVLGPALDSRYTSPELRVPELGEVGPWTDVYSLAIVLLELLSGGAIPRRPELRASDVGVKLPGQIEDLLARAVAENPLARPANAGVFWRALRELATEVAVADTLATTASDAEAPPGAREGEAGPFFTGTLLMVNAPGGALHLLTPEDIASAAEAEPGSTEPMAVPLQTTSAASPLASSLSPRVPPPKAPALPTRTLHLRDAVPPPARPNSSAPPGTTTGARAAFAISGSPDAIAARAALDARIASSPNVPAVVGPIAPAPISPPIAVAATPKLRSSAPPASTRGPTLVIVLLVLLLVVVATVAIVLLRTAPKTM
jgi:serine/threonine-protein kinase